MDIINFIIYLAIAISGTVFGSFFTLAVHRIPKHQDITHERSYCPNCNHKLQFLDLIPVWSYIFLGGKCRYCGQKIRPRYLILEICSGAVFVLLAFSHHITFESSIHEFILFGFDILFLCCMFITAGIDRELKLIPNSVMLYGAFIAVSKAIYTICYFKFFIKDDLVAFSTITTLLRQIPGILIIPAILLLLNFICLKVLKKDGEEIGYGDIKYLVVLGMYFMAMGQLIGFIISLFCALVGILLVGVINYIKKTNNKFLPTEIPMGFYFSIGYTIMMLLK